MEYRDIVVPFLGNQKISSYVETFRRRYWDASIPVDIEKIIDVKLQINIIPIPNLGSFCDTDALLASSFKDIYVDNDKFLDERYQNRLRFSFAHEIGHLVMHRELYDSFGIKGFEDYYQFIQQISAEKYVYIEAQANKFANYLLIPRDKLQQEKNKLLASKSLSLPPGKFDKNILNSYIASPLAIIFGVSTEPIEITLNQLED
ncbi:ImmA/IrrE family metallo-endopeptidase [Candidatus Kuenenbacteria bacterium]|nr:ImmA/IrrE family metallo-endopeptidase [Candidatus Kuenenbacteria bacterium]